MTFLWKTHEAKRLAEIFYQKNQNLFFKSLKIKTGEASKS
jgi:hypothetical protein